jgi:signal transduction histidine kinase
MLYFSQRSRWAPVIRILGLLLVAWTVLNSKHAPSLHGRGLVTLVCSVLALVGWLLWTFWSTSQTQLATDRSQITPDLFLLAAAGGTLAGAAPDTAASACVFIAVVSASVRSGFPNAVPVVLVGIAALAITDLIYGNDAIGLLAYSLGFVAAALGGSNARQSIVRAEQAELLLAQAQRSHEEQLRVAKLEESTRIAREIHDVLAHSLAGLAIQLEATEALLARGADPESVRDRVHRAHELAIEGLTETRRAVGALRGASDGRFELSERLRQLITDHHYGEGKVTLALDGDLGSVPAEVADAGFRVIQEALTNARKHAAGAAVSVSLRVHDELVVVVENEHSDIGGHAQTESLGGGYGLRGMRERAEPLGGTLAAGPHRGGWRVELTLPLTLASVPGAGV